MASILEVKNLTKKYGNTTVVDTISFDIQEGEIVGLLGPNGAGKTTIIQMLLSLLAPSEGEIRVFGKSLVENREEILEDMNFATSYSALPYNLTPYENLKIFSLFYGVSDYKAKAKFLLEEFDLGKFQNEKTGGLSSGEQMRLSLAKAFVNDPKLLLLDEPTSSLDPVIAKELRTKIYNRTKIINGTILWTSHNMREIELMCNRVIFLYAGKIVAADTPKNLKRQFQKQNLEEIFIAIVEDQKTIV